MATFRLAGADDAHAPGTIILDARAATQYWAGHIPAARHIDPALLVLARTDRASIERFHTLLAWTLSSLGLTTCTPVLVTGAENEVNVARVAWALAYAGVEQVSVLDGGIKAWQGELSVDAPQVKPARFELRVQDAYLATADDVLAASGQGTLVLDAREWDDYAGKRSNARRAGRVPGARFWDTRQELDGLGRFASTTQVSQAAGALGAAGKTIVYCGGGGRAARTFLALQLAGLAGTAVYPASWNEWGNVDAYPVDATPLSA
ncbi:rhodanese-like domain-containing protein [Massilia agilis]|uniref:Rhodanese-like domain-containing protein n=1 Tax=Massilia agilis TaxID=1811226 RepID=A0ABT2DGV3_9BURK|nr:rhodanese-like domain-containing protein [Massilia agilis]MCS0810449.1 rhodanese-like domain-containing protein [Massilia agilis]